MGRRYRLTARLEEGALAELFRAKTEAPGWGEVLVKLHLPRASEPAYAEAVAAAAARTRALGHPQAVAYDEVGMLAGRLAAIRPHLPGHSLGDALRRLSTKEVVLPPALALFVVAEASQVIAAAHAKGWAHGAITPGNILLGLDGRVRVVDFGALEAMAASPSLKQLAAKGRHAYRAPETRDVGPAAASADVYSLGAIAYELLTLREVAASRSGGLSTKRDALPPPSRVERRLNARIDPVVMRALDAAAPRRYRTALELAEALRGLFATLGYAPAQGDLVRFVKDLFPNEVAIAGVGGELPTTESFELQPVAASAAFEAEAASAAGFEERAPFTLSGKVIDPAPAPPNPDLAATFLREKVPEPAVPVEDALPAATSAPAPEPAGGAQANVEEWDAPPAAAPAPPAKPGAAAALAPPPARPAAPASPQKSGPVVEDWVAPPGVMPEAPRLVRGRKLSQATLGRRDTAESQVVVQTELTPTVPGVSPAPEEFADLTPQQKVPTNPDWHLPPPEPEPARRAPRANPVALVVAVLGAALLASATYALVSKRLRESMPEPVGVAPAQEEAATPASPERPPPEPEKPKPPPRPEPPALGSLSVRSDQTAAVFVDGVDVGKTTPLLRHALAAGGHTVLLVVGDQTREFNVTVKPGEALELEAAFGPAASPAPAPKKGSKPGKGAGP